jgi:diguanylate cyclase (GGDEF)-like protein
VDGEIGRLSGLPFRVLTFPKALEKHFETVTAPARCKRLWLEGLLAIGIFNLVLVVCRLAHPDGMTRSIVLMLFLVTPFAFAVNLLMLSRPPKLVRESGVALVTTTLALGLLHLGNVGGPVLATLAQFGAATGIVFANSVMRLRPLYALGASFVLAVGELTFYFHSHLPATSSRALGMSLTMATILFSLIANYSHNREERLNFLFCLRGDLLIGRLSQANKDLVIVAEEDALTGLANRRGFDRRLAEAWAEAANTGSVLAIVLIDLDHFKRLNDSFGHFYGDKVLRRVGRLLQETLRKEADFAARFGGEEFVILLPETPLELALLVAERIRKLVELAGLPALEGGAPFSVKGSATISCGVAAGSPLQFEDVQQLLDYADKALYQAKSSGRNAVCAGTTGRLLANEQQALWDVAGSAQSA